MMLCYLHDDHEHEVDDKISVIVASNTVAHPGTMMVECVHTMVTHTTMFGPERLPLDTRPAKLGGIQFLLHNTVRFKHLQDELQLVIVGGSDVARVRQPTTEVAVPYGDRGQDDGCGLEQRHVRRHVDQPRVIHPHLEPEIDANWQDMWPSLIKPDESQHIGEAGDQEEEECLHEVAVVGLENTARQTDDDEGSDCNEIFPKLGTDGYPVEKILFKGVYS